MQTNELQNGDIKLKDTYVLPVEGKELPKPIKDKYITINIQILLPKLLATCSGRLSTLNSRRSKYNTDISFRISLYTGSGDFIGFISGDSLQYFNEMYSSEKIHLYLDPKEETELLIRLGEMVKDYFEKRSKKKLPSTASVYWLEICTKNNFKGFILAPSNHAEESPTEKVEGF